MEIYYGEIDDDVLILSADGGLNAQTAEAFVSDLEKLIEGGLLKIIVDCEKLTHVSSFGLAILLRIHRRMKKQGGNVKICNVKGIMAQVLQLSRLNEVFEVYPDLNRALLAMREQS